LNVLESQTKRTKKILTWPLGIAVADSAAIFSFSFLVLLGYLAGKKEGLLTE